MIQPGGRGMRCGEMELFDGHRGIWTIVNYVFSNRIV